MKITKETLKKLIKEELVKEAYYDYEDSESGVEFENSLKALLDSGQLDPLFDLIYRYDRELDNPPHHVRGGGKLYTSSGYQVGAKMGLTYFMEELGNLYKGAYMDRKKGSGEEI